MKKWPDEGLYLKGEVEANAAMTRIECLVESVMGL